MGYKCASWNEIIEYTKENPDYKADLCIDCSGRTDAMQAALPFVQNGGTFLIFGVASPENTLMWVLNAYWTLQKKFILGKNLTF